MFLYRIFLCRIYSDGYLTGKYDDIESSGPYSNESDIINYGIYLFVCLKINIGEVMSIWKAIVEL